MERTTPGHQRMAKQTSANGIATPVKNGHPRDSKLLNHCMKSASVHLASTLCTAPAHMGQASRLAPRMDEMPNVRDYAH